MNTKSKFAFISYEDFNKFLCLLSSNYIVVFPKKSTEYFWTTFTDTFEFNSYRPITSIRQFFTPSKEQLDTYFQSSRSKNTPFCIVGAKSCDLTSLYIQDYTFLTQPQDPYYENMRTNNIIISSDCTSFKDVCFCLALEIKPYPETFFDLNISDIDSGYLVEVGSDKGKKLVEANKNFFKEPEEEHFKNRDKRRKEIVEKLSNHIKAQNIPKSGILYELVKKNYESPIWKQEALRCVECGGCIMNCPTCHCFLLFDETKNNQFIRARTWDGCQYKNFTKVAGGANPLKFRMQRLRNRYIKKFEFFYERINKYACTGCGRCIESCIAKIDIREIFKKLAQEQEAKV